MSQENFYTYTNTTTIIIINIPIFGGWAGSSDFTFDAGIESKEPKPNPPSRSPNPSLFGGGNVPKNNLSDRSITRIVHNYESSVLHF